MNKSGFLIPHVKGTYKGGDGKWYFIKALDMSKYLRRYRVTTGNYSAVAQLAKQKKQKKWISVFTSKQ